MTAEDVDRQSRWIALCCGTIIAALYVVAVVSGTELRHFVQTLPVWPGLALGLFGVRVARSVAMPVFLFWLSIMVLIWLYLLGWARVFSGHFSHTEIAMTLVIGISCALGIVGCVRGRRSGHWMVAGCVFLLSAGLQWVAFRISFLPGIASR